MGAAVGPYTAARSRTRTSRRGAAPCGSSEKGRVCCVCSRVVHIFTLTHARSCGTRPRGCCPWPTRVRRRRGACPCRRQLHIRNDADDASRVRIAHTLAPFTPGPDSNGSQFFITARALPAPRMRARTVLCAVLCAAECIACALAPPLLIIPCPLTPAADGGHAAPGRPPRRVRTGTHPTHPTRTHHRRVHTCLRAYVCTLCPPHTPSSRPPAR
jgi:hypothetical protein